MGDINDSERSFRILNDPKFAGKQVFWKADDIEAVLNQTKLEPNWTEDDAVECFARITEMKTRPASKFWRFDRFDHCWVVKLVDLATTTTIPSRVDSEVESARLQHYFRINCERFTNPSYYPRVEVMSNTSFSIGIRDGGSRVMYDGAFQRIMQICENIELFYDHVRSQINEEKCKCQQQSVDTRLQRKKDEETRDATIAQLVKGFADQSNKIQALEKQVLILITKGGHRTRNVVVTQLQQTVADQASKIQALEKQVAATAAKLGEPRQGPLATVLEKDIADQSSKIQILEKQIAAMATKQRRGPLTTQLDKDLADLASKFQALKHQVNATATKKKEPCQDPLTSHLQKAITDQSRKIQILEKHATEINTKLQFEKLLKEIQAKQFGDVLIQIALTERHAKAESLGFGRLLQEMEQRGFGQLVVNISATKRIAKAAELTKKIQLLQQEAQWAGVSLGTLDSGAMVFPTVTLMTGEISVDARDVPMAVPVPKTL